MDMLELMQKVAKFESALASCALSDNDFAQKHLDKSRNMSLEEKYIYFTKIFNELENKYK